MKTQIIKKVALILSAALISQIAIADDTARDLFFNPSKAAFGSSESGVTITSNGSIGSNFSSSDNEGLGTVSGGYYNALENPGVQYSIELLRKGSNSTKQVNGNHVFKSGDRIRVRLSSNGNGVMHALHKGSTGDSLLIPASNGGEVLNGQEVVLPAGGGWLVFDENKGIEKIDVVFASNAMAAENGIVATANNSQSLMTAIRQVVSNYSNSKDLVSFSQAGEKNLYVEGGSNIFSAVGPVNRTERPAQQVAQAVYTAPASYSVNMAGKPVVVKISLKHQ